MSAELFEDKAADLEAEIFGNDDDDSEFSDFAEEAEKKEEKKIAKAPRLKKLKDDYIELGEGEVEKKKKKRREKGERRKRIRREEVSHEGEGGAEKQPEVPINPHIAEFDAVVQSFKNKKNRIDYDEMEADERILVICNEMKDAALKDIEANSDKKPAVSKLKMLPKVIDLLKKTYLYEQLIENDILDPMRMWLEPLPDGSLPSIDIRNFLFEIMPKLPISTDSLRQSRLGRVVFFYAKCKRESPEIRRKAVELVNIWSRPLLQGLQNRNTPQKVTTRRDSNVDHRADGRMAAGEALYVTAHARIPQANRATYMVQPEINIASNIEPRAKIESKLRKYTQKTTRF